MQSMFSTAVAIIPAEFAVFLKIHSGLPFEPSTRTQDPIVTGAGIVACKFDNGILSCFSFFLFKPT
jgi:hypothetical protein